MGHEMKISDLEQRVRDCDIKMGTEDKTKPDISKATEEARRKAEEAKKHGTTTAPAHPAPAHPAPAHPAPAHPAPAHPAPVPKQTGPSPKGNKH